jgi:hypothetical protein
LSISTVLFGVQVQGLAELALAGAGRLGERVERAVRPLPPRRRAARRPRRPPAGAAHRPGGLHRRVGPLRPGPGRDHARRRPLRAGPRRRAVVGRHPRHPRDRVPRRRGAHAGDEPLHLRLRGRRLGRTAGRRRPDPGHRLALDLLRQRPDRRADRAGRALARRGAARHRPRPGHRRARCGDRHLRHGARRLRHRRGAPLRLGVTAHARLRLGGRRRAGGVPRARGAWRTRSCHCGCCACARWRARAWSAR